MTLPFVPTDHHALTPGQHLSSMLAHQALLHPDRIAVAGDEGTLSFAELHRGARALGAAIRAAGLPAGGTVGLYCDASLDLIRAVWGILDAGQAYLPLAPDYPDERIRYILENSGTRLVLTQPHLVARLRELAPADILILGCDAAAAPLAGPAGDPADLAYVIYTSGSTGRPKGVMIEHRSIVHQMRWLLAEGHLEAGHRILQKTPISFDAAQWEILAPAVGATVVTGRPGLFRDPEALLGMINRHAVTTLQCVPTLLNALVEDEGFAACASLRAVFSGGEALSQGLARRFLERMPGVGLVNLYGPTECTINATALRVSAGILTDPAKSVPIGHPVSATPCLVLDAAMQPVAPGQEGELYIGGVQVARGYLNNPDQTARAFVAAPGAAGERLYRTGDICVTNPDGSLQFAGRADNQIKLRGYRVELEEIAIAIETHPWVRHAAAVVTTDGRTGQPVLTACVELNEKEAALMDQGHAGAHHQSKANKVQVKAQLSNPGLREAERDAHRPVLMLPGAGESEAQRHAAFGRKTYRFYEGGAVTGADMGELARLWHRPRAAADAAQPLTLAGLGAVLRWFGAFQSPERLLPKYAYASPGALYATQLYVETLGIAGVPDGLHYFHPLRHVLVRIADATTRTTPGLRLHFSGKRGAIEPVYKNNIQEVLEMETGHMLGLFDAVLGTTGHGLAPVGMLPDMPARLDVAADDFYLGSFDCVPGRESWKPAVDLFAQPLGRGVEGLRAGLSLMTPEGLEPLAGEGLEARHVIAINQAVFARASFGVAAVSREREPWLQFIALGFVLHRFQAELPDFGFMSSGYSSKSGHPLPASLRLDQILGRAGVETGHSYFFIGGRITPEQRRHEGMNEDAVHMQGPAEMIREALGRSLPDYMIPSRVVVFDRIPLTANGKVDRRAVTTSERLREATAERPYVAPATPTEAWLAAQWARLLKFEPVSREDDFFAAGGNSLAAITLLNRVNREFGLTLPAQVIFEAPRLADLAARVEKGAAGTASRLVRLNGEAGGRAVFCWPGLGGYPMNLRTLAQSLVTPRPFFGIQALGLNPGETPAQTIAAMARQDIAEITALAGDGPVTLWGYSFGARVAFETAWQLEQAGRKVDQLVLICPGNPRVEGAGADAAPAAREARLTNRTFAAVLLSVFLGRIDLGETDRFLAAGRTGGEDFTALVRAHRPELDPETIRRIVDVVTRTYEFEYSFRELEARRITAPITIIKARGDDYSFLDQAEGYAATPPRLIEVACDHYEILRGAEAANLAALIEAPRTAPSLVTPLAAKGEAHAAH